MSEEGFLFRGFGESFRSLVPLVYRMRLGYSLEGDKAVIRSVGGD